QVVQFQHVHVADGDLFWEWFARATVVQSCLTIASNQTNTIACWVDVVEQTGDFFSFCTVEDRGGHIDRSGFAWQVRQLLEEVWFAFDLPTVGGGPAEVQFHNLAQVHTSWYTQWVQDHVDRSTVFHEWHVFNWENLGDNTLVTVTTGHLVTVGNLTFLCNVYTDQLVYAC